MAQGQRKIGLHLSMASSGLAECPGVAKAAEERGYSSLWIAEVNGPDAFLTLGAIALATTTADLATGIVPIQIRTPGAMAMGFLTLNELSGGRAIAGLGVSSPVIVERWHGTAYGRPVTAMRECVTIMRQLFAEGRSKFEGKVYRSDFRLGFRITQRRPRIYLAALNPPMLRLAGEIADGVLLNYSPPEAVAPMVAEIRAGAEKAGRSPAEVDIAIYLRMCITPDEGAAVAAFKRELAGYAFVDAYNAMFARYGMADEFAEVRRLWREGKREEAPAAISDKSAYQIGAFGSAAAGYDFVARFRAAGVTHPVIFPIGPGRGDLAEFSNTMNAMAGA
jgi:probable F420-dependent oxidoreductase